RVGALVPFELISVGDDSQVNLHGLAYFYRAIFVPFLRKHRLRMTIIGSVCNKLDFHDWYITKFSEVPENLHAYYDCAKLVVVPVLERSGMSRETIECLEEGRAVVTTPAQASGHLAGSKAFLELDMVGDPGGAARAIRELLGSESKITQLKRTAREYYRANFSADRYFAPIDSVMDSLNFPAESESSRFGWPPRHRSQQALAAACAMPTRPANSITELSS